jgi:hypothetical protein
MRRTTPAAGGEEGDVIVDDEDGVLMAAVVRGDNDRMLGEKAVATEAIAKRMRKVRIVDGEDDWTKLVVFSGNY